MYYICIDSHCNTCFSRPGFSLQSFRLRKWNQRAEAMPAWTLMKCGAIVDFYMASICYMLSIWFTIVIHYHSMYILPMNPQAAGPTTGWKTRRQTGIGMVGGWALSLPYLAFLNWSLDNLITPDWQGMSRGFPLSIPNKIWKVAVSQLCMVNNGESWSVNGQSTVNPQEISVSAILVSRKLSSIIRLVIGYIYMVLYGFIMIPIV